MAHGQRLAGKVAIVSGGARGMGATHAAALAGEGARVVIGDVLDDAGRAVAADSGGLITYAHLDVTRYRDWERIVETAVAAYGSLDVLVNNAGIVNYGTILDYSLEDWHRIIDVNLSGTFYGIKAAAPALMRSSRNPSIINVSSTAGLRGYAHIPGYTASKFGVRGLTKSLALELGAHGIRCNSVHPGLVRTPMTEGVDRDYDTIALHRIGEPEELSQLIVFLAGDNSTYCTGTEFVADGGELAGTAAAPASA